LIKNGFTLLSAPSNALCVMVIFTCILIFAAEMVTWRSYKHITEAKSKVKFFENQTI